MEKDKRSTQKNKQQIAEQAININKTDGKKINHQQDQRQDIHQPRDNA